MVQAARSGKQNILEGSQASETSKETEIKLTNVARASLEELLEDYRDFLRVRGLRLWDKDSREAKFVTDEAGKARPGNRKGCRCFEDPVVIEFLGLPESPRLAESGDHHACRIGRPVRN
jgi:hypothetical protein